jgi:hypothetical protein
MITNIGWDYGYSSSNYSTLQHHFAREVMFFIDIRIKL